MGVMSSLALVLIPLLRPRDSSTTPRQVPIDSETKRLKAENVALIATNERVRAEIEELRREILDCMDMIQVLRERERAREAMNAQKFYLQGHAQQSVLGQQSVWRDCTCVPGRSALLRGETP